MSKFGRLMACAALLCGLGDSAWARDPFVTVSAADRAGTPPTNIAWWLRDMVSRPTGTMVAGVSLETINASLDETETPWCQAEALTIASFASPDGAVQAEIDATWRGLGANPFRADTSMTGRALQAVVGHFQGCGGESAPFVMLVNMTARTPRIAFLRMFTDWQPFIVMRRAGHDLVFSSCLECDHGEALSYDRGQRRFYWRNVGD